MIAELAPYPKMKNSGVEWLGEVPEHWEVPRLGKLLRERRETNADGSRSRAPLGWFRRIILRAS